MSTAPTRRKTLEKTEPFESTSTAKFQCYRCGMQFGARRKFFPVSHSPLYRGTSYLPFCSECVDKMYEDYVNELGDQRAAMKRMCMKLDLYWCDALYDMAEKSAVSHSRVRTYIAKANLARYIDKTYDDTIRDEERVATMRPPTQPAITVMDDYLEEDIVPDDDIEVPDDVRLFWGPGYTNKMYSELEDRRKFWMSRFPDGYETTIGEEALIRQVCNLEIDINHDRAAGKSIEKSVNTLNTLLGSLNVKPTQKKEDDSAMSEVPFGVGIAWCERHKPIAEPSEEFRDVDGIRRYISVWLYGHLAKMMKKKNLYSKLYEDEIAKMRVEKPEYFDEDDEVFLNNALSEDGDEDWP